MLIKLLAVGTGGFFGCISRFLIGTLAMSLSTGTYFPYGTMIANMLGCFIIGFLGAYVEAKHTLNPALVALVITGFLGGLTTFSSFGLETFTLLRESHFLYGIINICVHIFCGLLMVGLGYHLMTKILA